MYVCVCNAVTERDIERAVADGASTFEELQDQLRVSTCCGACREITEVILNEQQASSAFPCQPTMVRQASAQTA